MELKTIEFPKNFLWGTATSAHQIEGGNKNNQWWLWEQEKGHIHDGTTSEIACDHWNRYKEDFAILTDLNQNAYRMSIEWSRVFPGPGRVDSQAIEHYHKMIDYLNMHNITPFVTLLHFTYPIWWEKEGGLKNQQKSHLDHFRQFVEVIIKEFSSKVKFWNTINEIEIVAVSGYFAGSSPPGEKGIRNAITALNTLLKMHNIAYHTIKKIDPSSQVGLVKNMVVLKPMNKKSFSDRLLTKFSEYIFNGSIFRALRTGKLPNALLRSFKGLKKSYDFIGLNYYNFALISRKNPGLFVTAEPGYNRDLLCAGIGWQPYPEGILTCLKRLEKEFPKTPIYITENGIGTDNDLWRQKLLIDHLRMIYQSIQEGVDVRGYFHWSLIDNFEWSEGYSSRFGLVDVDFRTLKRTIKDSGYLYSKIAEKNSLTSDILDKYSSWPLKRD